MDSPNHPKSDPSLLLLNEVEILLAQTRLMELYLKQGHVTAASEAARIQDQHQAELAALRRALAEKEQTLAARQNAASDSERKLLEQVQNLQGQVNHQQHRLDECTGQLRDADSEAAALRERIAQLQTAKAEAEAAAQQTAGARLDLQSALAALRRELEVNRQDLHRQQLVSRTVQENLHAQLEQLRGQLAEKQVWAAAGVELQQAKIEIIELRQRVAELQLSRQEAEAAAARALEQARARFEIELAGLQTALGERDRTLRETQTAIGTIEQSLKAEIQPLLLQLSQKQELIHTRDGELRAAHEQIAALQQRAAELETAHQQAAENAAEALRLRSSCESEISTLRHEVAVRERALSERQEAVTAVELALHGKIQSLHQELARSHSTTEERAREVHELRAEADALRERMGQLESAVETNLAARQVADDARQSLQAELARSNAALAHKETLLGETAALHGQLEEQRRRFDESNAELERLRAEIVFLQEQKAQSEASRHELEQNRQQAAAMRQEFEARLQAQEVELRALQSRADEEKVNLLREQETRYQALEAQLGSEIGHLRFQLEQQQSNFEQGSIELSQLRAETAALYEQKELSEQARRELEQHWQQAAALRQDFEIRLQVKEDELRAAQARADEIKSQIEARLADLQVQLTEWQLLAESRATEIDNLKIELSRLAEQAAARDAAAEELRARLLNETESNRAAHQTEVNALRDEHTRQQRSQAEQLAQQQAQVAGLAGQIHELEQRAADSESQIQARERNIAAEAAESAALRTRAQELENLRQAEQAAAESAVEQARSKLETELASLRHELQQKTWALAQQQASIENLAAAHRSQIQKLEERLAEHQDSVQDRSGEVEGAQSQTRPLQRRIKELELELEQTRWTAARGAEQVREEYLARIEELNAEGQRQAAELHKREIAQSRSEQSLRGEIERLVREAEEKNLILQNRNDELVRAKFDRDALQESYRELASATTRNETAVSEDAERMRAEFQAQLALLQAELSQKEWALEEQRAAASGMDQQYREQIESLRRQMAQLEARSPEQPENFVIGDEDLTENQRERDKRYREVMDGVLSRADPSFPASENRRWRSRFGWKRRWR